MDAVDVDLGHLLGDVGFGRQRQRLGDEGMVRRAAGQRLLEPVHEPVIENRLAPGALLRNQPEHQLQRVALAGFPTHERVGVVGHEEAQIGVGRIALQDHRRREAAQQRRHRTLPDAGEDEALLGLGQLQDARGAAGHAFALQAQRQRLARGIEQADRDRDDERRLVRLARSRRRRLRDRERVGAGRGIVGAADDKARRAGLAVPAAELAEVAPGCRLHRGDEILAGHRLAVVALEVDPHAPLKGVLADQRVQHADDLRALLVDRGRIEVVDLDVALRPHRMGKGPRVLQELGGAQAARVRDPLDRARVQIRGELLVAEHGQALLEGELEPVAAGHPVAGPVVEILMRDHRLHAHVVGVGRRLGPGQDVFGVEDVQPLVLHCPEVEVGHGDDHELIEIVFEAEAILVPLHRFLERGHGVVAFVDLARLGIDLQGDLAARAGDESVLELGEAAGDQGEQVAGLGEGILPQREMAAVRQRARIDPVAVGEQDRIRRLRRPRSAPGSAP